MFPHGGIILRGSRGPEIDKDHRLTPGTIPRALRIAAHYRWSIIGFLVVTVGASVLGVVPPMLLRFLVDHAIPERNRGAVGLVALAGVGVALLVAGSGLLARYLSARVGEGLIFDLRVRLFDHVQRMPLAFFTRTQTGSLMSRLQSDVVGAQSAVTGTLQTVVSSTITTITTLTFMLILDVRLTLISLLVLPLFVIPSTRTGRRLQKLTREQMKHNADMSSSMQERFDVSGALLAKLFGRADDETQLFAERAGRVRDLGVKSAVLFRTLFATFGLVAALGTAIIYWLGGTAAVEGRLTAGDVVAFVALLSQLYGPMTALTNARTELMTSFVSFERVFEVLDLPHAISDAPGATELPEGPGKIEFEHVHFAYPRASEVSIASLEPAASFQQGEEQREVLSDVSFVAEPGQTVALVGPSGAGKTTLSMLVPRLYEPTSGTILVDGIDIRTVTQESLRRAIGVVSQDPHLFHDSVANNLRYAKPEATDDEVLAALAGAQLSSLVEAMPDGTETVVGERGYRLSGGEKQRLAIARVLLKAPRIVILDEATAHLDSESEALIQRALQTALTGRTALVIAHRLSTIRRADSILVLDGGRIVQRGTHEGLLTQGGLYADLYRTQFESSEA
ncbi:MAG: ABC transporter ATP-binding protein [Actinomycetota bacterium]